jgi:hypothetical protein
MTNRYLIKIADYYRDQYNLLERLIDKAISHDSRVLYTQGEKLRPGLGSTLSSYYERSMRNLLNKHVEKRLLKSKRMI